MQSSSFQLCSERVYRWEDSINGCAVLLPEDGSLVAWMGKQPSPCLHGTSLPSGAASGRSEGAWSQHGRVSRRCMWHTSLSRESAVLWRDVNLWAWDVRLLMLVADVGLTGGQLHNYWFLWPTCTGILKSNKQGKLKVLFLHSFSDFKCVSTYVCLHLNNLTQLMSHRIGKMCLTFLDHYHDFLFYFSWQIHVFLYVAC